MSKNGSASDFPRMLPNIQAHRLYGLNKALNHIHYAKLALYGLGDWADEATTDLDGVEDNLTRYRDRELVS